MPYPLGDILYGIGLTVLLLLCAWSFLLFILEVFSKD